MKIDLNNYAVHRIFIKQQYLKNNDKDIRPFASVYSCSTHCPLIAVLHFLAEFNGYSKEMCDIIDSISKFYGYKEIKGQSIDSPYIKGILHDSSR
jgi:hypothetical protein